MPEYKETDVWVTGDGDRIAYKDLTNDHLDNLIKYLRRTRKNFNGELITFLRYMQIARKINSRVEINVKKKVEQLCSSLY